MVLVWPQTHTYAAEYETCTKPCVDAQACKLNVVEDSLDPLGTTLVDIDTSPSSRSKALVQAGVGACGGMASPVGTVHCVMFRLWD